MAGPAGSPLSPSAVPVLSLDPCLPFRSVAVAGALPLRTPELLRGGLLTSTFSCVLLAELAVGRIKRARKPSSGVLAVLPARDGGRAAVEAGPSEGRLGRVRKVVGLFFALTALVLRSLALVPLPLLAADAAVGAVRCEGSAAGRVGDLGVGLWKPEDVRVGGFVVLVVVGEAGLDLAPALEELVAALADEPGASEALGLAEEADDEATEGRLV